MFSLSSLYLLKGETFLGQYLIFLGSGFSQECVFPYGGWSILYRFTYTNPLCPGCCRKVYLVYRFCLFLVYMAQELIWIMNVWRRHFKTSYNSSFVCVYVYLVPK